MTDSNTRRAVRRHRDLQLQRRPRGAKKARVRIRQEDRIVDSPFELSQESFVVKEAGEEDVVRLPLPPEDADEGDEVAERLARLNQLYQQERGEEPRKDLFFCVEDRSRETLERFIVGHVKPGSTIVTDEWTGYNHLKDLGFAHNTVCHKREYSRNVIEMTRNNRLTTNHIERLWLEARKTTAHMTLDAS